MNKEQLRLWFEQEAVISIIRVTIDVILHQQLYDLLHNRLKKVKSALDDLNSEFNRYQNGL